MKIKLVLFIAMIALFAGSALAASTSAGYKMTSEIIDAGAAAAASTSYRLLGKARERELAVRSAASFNLSEGFIRSAYFSGVTPVLSPIVTSITPAGGANTGLIEITDLSGANFQAGALVKLAKSGQTDIAAINVVVLSASKITCVFNLAGADSGAWDVTVTNPDGRSGTLPSAFTVAHPAPTITSITPGTGTNNGPVNITDLAGTNFRAGAAVRLTQTGQSDLIATTVSVDSASKITCVIDLTGKAIGPWDVLVANEDGKIGTLPGGFKVQSPTITVVKPVVSSQNPFNPSVAATSLDYSLSKDANIIIYVYNIRGERVWQYAAPAGTSGGSLGDNSVPWNGLTAFQSIVSSGVYIVDVTTTDGGSFQVLSRTKIAVVR